MKPSSSPRFERLDALRGLWMLWMAGFHFAFDLAHYRLIDANFYTDPLWTGQRMAILSGFLFWAGLTQGLVSSPRFWRRWTQIAAAALLVSVGSGLMFPRSWISFGVLHAFALLLPLARFGLGRLPTGALLGLAALSAALPWWVQHPWFDSRWTNWLGLVTHKPVTEDYVPLLPWAAPLLLGLVAARFERVHQLLAAPRAAGLFQWAQLQCARLGRWPLSFYLLHQPLLLGMLHLYLAAAA